MNKKQFVGAIAADTGLSQATVARVLDSARDISHNVVSQGGSVKLVGWMIIGSIDVAERGGFNPKTGKHLTIPAHRRVKIKAAEGYGA